MSGTVINNVIFTSTKLYQHQKHALLDNNKNRNNHEKLTMFSERLADRAELVEQKNVMHMQIVSILSTIFSIHKLQDSKTVHCPDVTEGQKRHRQCLNDTTVNSQQNQRQQPNNLQLASWGKPQFQATISLTLPYTGQPCCLSCLGLASPGMNKEAVVQGALYGWVTLHLVLHGSPCPLMMDKVLLTQLANNPVWSSYWLSFHGKSRARYNLVEPIPLQIEHVAT